MKIVLLMILVISVILEATLIPFPITLLSVLLSFAFLEEDAALFAFVAGLLLDLFSLRILGLTSLFFLTAFWVRQKYEQKVSPTSLVFQFPYFIIATVAYSYLFYRHINIWFLLFFLFLSFFVILLLKPYFSEKSYRKRLKVE